MNEKVCSLRHGYFSGKYKTQLYDEKINDFLPSSPGIGMHVEVKDPGEKIIMSRYFSAEGRFTFTSHAPGEHSICLHSNSTRWSLFAGGRLVSPVSTSLMIVTNLNVLLFACKSLFPGSFGIRYCLFFGHRN